LQNYVTTISHLFAENTEHLFQCHPISLTQAQSADPFRSYHHFHTPHSTLCTKYHIPDIQHSTHYALNTTHYTHCTTHTHTHTHTHYTQYTYTLLIDTSPGHAEILEQRAEQVCTRLLSVFFWVPFSHFFLVHTYVNPLTPSPSLLPQSECWTVIHITATPS
jgi:hypothetical protein